MRPSLPPALALLLGLGLSALPALAEQSGFARLDTDGNGVVSRTEFLALRKQMFATIDADNSGTITRAEIAAARAALPQGRTAQSDDRIWAQDANKDGQLTLAEYTSQTRGFDFADRNNDGALSPAEFDRIARFLRAAQN